MSEFKTVEARGTVWQEDESDDGGHLVAARARIEWADDDELALHIVREDGATGATLYLTAAEAMNLMVAVGAELTCK